MNFIDLIFLLTLIVYFLSIDIISKKLGLKLKYLVVFGIFMISLVYIFVSSNTSKDYIYLSLGLISLFCLLIFIAFSFYEKLKKMKEK